VIGHALALAPRSVARLGWDRWIAAGFAIGSACFFIGPFPGFVQLVGQGADGVVFFFGVSAVASFVVPSTGSVLALATANWCTALGALCFLVGAVLLARHQPDTRHTTSRPPLSQEV
jgi:hypothetical protein